METLGQRVAKLRIARGWSQHELARQAKVKPQNIQQLEAGDVKHPRYLPQLAAAFSTTVEHLVTGSAPGPSAPPGPIQAYAVRDWEDEAELDPLNDVMISVYEVELQQGHGRIVPEYVETRHQLPFSRSWLRRRRVKAEDCKAFPVRGDSMLPTLSDGDLVLVNTADIRIRDGKIFALIIGNEPKLKRLKRKADGTLVILSDNPAFEPEEVPPERAESVFIIGRAIQRSGDL